MEIYRNYSCKKIADDYYLVFDETDSVHVEIGGFTHGDVFVYPKYKGHGLGFVIRMFMEDINKKSG